MCKIKMWESEKTTRSRRPSLPILAAAQKKNKKPEILGEHFSTRSFVKFSDFQTGSSVPPFVAQLASFSAALHHLHRSYDAAVNTRLLGTNCHNGALSSALVCVFGVFHRIRSQFQPRGQNLLKAVHPFYVVYLKQKPRHASVRTTHSQVARVLIFTLLGKR